MTVLLLGRNGQVGHELQRTLVACAGPDELVALGAAELDLADPDAIVRVVRQLRPRLIVNAAAYTAVDRAETEPGKAMAVNAEAPGILAEEARRLDARLIHYSTDYVFNGQKDGPYTEDDATQPLNTYGRSKRLGEQAIQASGCRHLILRTSWVYGWRGHNFLLTMRRLLRERDQVSVVSDQWGAPTWSVRIAETTAALVRRLDAGADANGIFHLAAGGRTSWYGFACAILAALPEPERQARIVPIPSRDYPAPAQRPPNSQLGTARLCRAFDLTLPDWFGDFTRACRVGPDGGAS